MNNKVELLSPAGNFDCFLAALSAGADAVYLGGEKFGARAYANNFTTEEIVEALRIAHIFNKKIYLTVNTLVKESELNELIPFMTPLVEAKLDGVIVQDLGVFFKLREAFPKLELHASTQMTITGKYGAKFLKEIGATRIVPARELSLEEIKEIKEETGLEIETFIHGAMCYAYSGQCLFSSILGGRSGNRGRCAGPCRLPYDTDKKNVYPLSLKDMYTLDLIPKLIEAGIDSFKIEGRMKSPEYVAGVTAMYRKYIDQYLKNPEAKYIVSKEDEKLIRNLYIRSDICSGYYFKHNSKDMVTLHEPGYNGSDEGYLNLIRNKYLKEKPFLNISGKGIFEAGKACSLELNYKDITVKIAGDEVSEAKNRPLTRDDIFDKLNKTGNTLFRFDNLELEVQDNIFMPVKAINELRRIAIEKLEASILEDYSKPEIKYNKLTYSVNKNKLEEAVFASVNTLEQLETVLKYDFCRGIYINSDLFLVDSVSTKILKLLKANSDRSFFISFPNILRKRSYKYLQNLYDICNMDIIKGVLARNIEAFIYLKENNYQGEIIADYSIYSWNNKALQVLDNMFTRTTVPVELNKHEIIDLKNLNREMVIYSRLPLMYSANCLQNTFKGCINDRSGKHNIYYIKDRHANNIPVLQNCFHCYNILYNPVVMSLHNQFDSIHRQSFDVLRIEFSIENANDTDAVMDYYSRLLIDNIKNEFPFKDYTAGHFKRGVE